MSFPTVSSPFPGHLHSQASAQMPCSQELAHPIPPESSEPCSCPPSPTIHTTHVTQGWSLLLSEFHSVAWHPVQLCWSGARWASHIGDRESP